MKNTKLFDLGWDDLIKGAIITILSSTLTMVINQFQNGSVDWSQVGKIALVATLSYILKQLGTDEEGKVLGIGK
jgi:hypothetical protein